MYIGCLWTPRTCLPGSDNINEIDKAFGFRQKWILCGLQEFALVTLKGRPYNCASLSHRLFQVHSGNQVFLVGDLALFAAPAIGLTFIPSQVANILYNLYFYFFLVYLNQYCATVMPYILIIGLKGLHSCLFSLYLKRYLPIEKLFYISILYSTPAEHSYAIRLLDW